MHLKINYPPEVVRIAEILAENHYKAYAVGGCMRDALMGRKPNDWDMTTDCSPEKMLEIFDAAGLRTIPTGLKHGTVSVLLNGELYECTTFRIDGSYTDSRHPDQVTFTKDVTEDLRRRDFTVNAIAGDPIANDPIANDLIMNEPIANESIVNEPGAGDEGSDKNEIIDVFGGREDIERKIIRAVGDPETRFTEDALRILRAIRFATVLDFTIEKDTFLAAIKLGSRLQSVSAERKSVELQKILLSPHADRGISLLLEADLAGYVHPEICAPEVALSTLPASFPVRLAALFRSVPDLSCMKLSGEVVKSTRLLRNDTLYGEICTRFSCRGATARLMLSKYGDFAEDAALLHGDRALAEIIAEERKSAPCVTIRQLAVNGNDLISAGIPARQLGGIMNALLEAVIEDQSQNQKEALTEAARSLSIN